MSKWLTLRLVLAVVGLGDCAALTVCAKPPAISSVNRLSVDDLANAEFKRVTGKAYGGSSFDTGGPGSWYEHTTAAPTVVYDGISYRMWFVGSVRTKDPGVPYGFYERVGLATSRDGINWKVANDGKPVLDLGPVGSADARGLAHPYVLKVGAKFMMWYGGIDGKQAKGLGLVPGHVRIERICLATSADGIHWKRSNDGKPVLDIGPKGSSDSIQATGMHVLRINNRFVMWYGAYNGLHALAMATSPDGLRWTKANGGKPLTGLLGEQQLGPTVYSDGSRYFLLYEKITNHSWAMFAATSDDGIHWETANDSEPVLGPPSNGNFATAGKGMNHSVHPSQIIILGRQVRVWYGGEDGSPPHYQRIGLMEARIP